MSKLEKMVDKRDRQALKATIEENLRKVYQDVLGEEVPDRFKLLLEQLRQQSVQQSVGNGAAASSAPPSGSPSAGLSPDAPSGAAPEDAK